MSNNNNPEISENENVVQGGGMEQLDTEKKVATVEEKDNISEEKQNSSESAQETMNEQEQETTETNEPELLAGEIPKVAEEQYTDNEYEELIQQYESTMKDIEEGELVTGKVIGKNDQEVIVDVGFKSEGTIPLHEFQKPEEVNVGDEIEVYLEKMENKEGLIVLSKRRADFMRMWNKVKEYHERDELIEGVISRRIKGGMVVNLMGVDAFLPGSQIDVRPIPNMDDLVGNTYKFKIIKVNKKRRNIVVSRRQVIEEKREKERQKLLAELEEGQVREGVIKNITDFGAFIDLGGVDGLLHITDISWGRIRHPSELLKIGDNVNVKILNFDEETGRISLGYKQLTPYPWDTVEEKYPVGKKVKGKVVSITDYGAFVELEKGIEGLIHISEMSWVKHIKHPSMMLSIGDEVEAVVLSVNKEEEKISLSLKQTKEDPWETLDEKYPVGSKVVGKVRNLTNFGAFIELEEGIDGLVHISDMSWTRRVRHPNEIVHKGDDVEVIVLGIDKHNHRISLGIKQLKENPWDDLEAKYVVGHETEGTITKLLEQGVVVELPDDVEGFVPISHLATDNIDNPSDVFSEGDTLPLKVIDFDKHNRRIVLSVKAYFEDKEARELGKYKEKYSKKVPTKLGEVVDEETGKKLSKTPEKTPKTKAEKAKKSEKQEPEKTKEAPEAEPKEEKAEPEKKADAEETEEPKKEKSAEAEEKSQEKESEEETKDESQPEAEKEAAEEPKEETPEPEEEKNAEESDQTEENTEEESEKEPEANEETEEKPQEEPEKEEESESEEGDKDDTEETTQEESSEESEKEDDKEE